MTFTHIADASEDDLWDEDNIEDAWGDEEILKPEDDDEDLWMEDEEGKT